MKYTNDKNTDTSNDGIQFWFNAFYFTDYSVMKNEVISLSIANKQLLLMLMVIAENSSKIIYHNTNNINQTIKIFTKFENKSNHNQIRFFQRTKRKNKCNWLLRYQLMNTPHITTKTSNNFKHFKREIAYCKSYCNHVLLYIMQPLQLDVAMLQDGLPVCRDEGL